MGVHGAPPQAHGETARAQMAREGLDRPARALVPLQAEGLDPPKRGLVGGKKDVEFGALDVDLEKSAALDPVRLERAAERGRRHGDSRA